MKIDVAAIQTLEAELLLNLLKIIQAKHSPLHILKVNQ